MQAFSVGVVSGFLRDLQVVTRYRDHFADNYTKVKRMYCLDLSFSQAALKSSKSSSE
jgi:hypothetical protein